LGGGSEKFLKGFEIKQGSGYHRRVKRNTRHAKKKEMLTINFSANYFFYHKHSYMIFSTMGVRYEPRQCNSTTFILYNLTNRI